ncbi:MAG TPA: type II secretion system protein GspM [Solirubrobacteraceae bacterium]
MTQRDKILIVLAAAIAVLAGGWFFIAQPKRGDSRALDAQLTAARTELAGTASRAAQYRAARAALLKHPEVFTKAGRALPSRVAMPDLLRALTRTARGTGVSVNELTTGAGTSSTPGIGSVNLELGFGGNFLSLQRYLARLQRFVEVSSKDVAARGRLVSLDSVHLSAGEEKKGLSAKVSATVYVLQPGALSVGATPAAATTAAPAAASATPAPASTSTAGVTP